MVAMESPVLAKAMALVIGTIVVAVILAEIYTAVHFILKFW